ncbi:F-box/kelch-repeat protein At2g24250-like [Pistacia vera]|uniref:F-box/kelch-repeat protein At2g24250-like n=1 Tax=Pistacia vera TaxID=55513 RepID=UPI0012637AE6|nr:F-box/kelch-repeat protein At2g24250-like [Pistacia vera]
MLRLRAVCRSFRATIPLPSGQYPFPHSILATTDFLEGPFPDEEDHFDFTVSTVYAIEPLNKTSHTHEEETPQTWVVRVQERNPGRVRIIDPIFGSECKDLSDHLPKSLNLLDYRVTEITKSYQLVSTDEQHIVVKLTFSSSLDENDDEFAVMARDNDMKELGIWRNLDKKWSIIDMGLQYPEVLEDIIYHNHKFYAVLPKGHTVTVDPKSLAVTGVAEKLQLDWEYWMIYSIALNNDLFLIVQFQEYDDYDEYNIAIFKLNEENQKWVPVVDGSELEDRVLFVGKSSCAYSFSMKEVAGCRFWGLNFVSFRFPKRKWLICVCLYIWLLTSKTGKSSLSILGRNREEAAEMIVRKHPKLDAMMVKEGSIVNICGYGLIVSRQPWKGEANAANQAENGEMNT